MENAAKALEIAAGVLIGVLLMALIVYFFKSAGEWPQQEEDMASVEQVAKFNLEYEVYNKKGMYGVDVISCLNKAKDNNDKYFGDQSKLGFLTEGRHPKEYVIDVFVKINVNTKNRQTNNPSLEESIEVRYINDSKKEIKNMGGLNDPKLSNIKMSQVFKDIQYDPSYTKFSSDDFIENAISTTNFIDLGSTDSDGYYSLLKEDKSDYNKTSGIYPLLGFASKNMKITVRNTDSNSLNIWSSCTWTTALYNLKTKRFKCDELKYNEKTGRINAIYFSEI